MLKVEVRLFWGRGRDHFLFVFETGSHWVALTDLELTEIHLHLCWD